MSGTIPENHLAHGMKGETLAESYLTSRGLRFVARNARTRLGEIDLIMKDGATWVFIEVKARRSTHRGHPLEAVTGLKQRRLGRLALAYLQQHRAFGQRARFDVVGVLLTEPPVISWIAGAFEIAE